MTFVKLAIGALIVVCVVVPPASAGQGINYLTFIDIWSSSHPDKVHAIAGSRAQYNSSNLLYGWYLHENRVRDLLNHCSGSTLNNAGETGQVTHVGQYSFCDRLNGCDASAICWACIRNDDPDGGENVFLGRAVVAVVFFDVLKDDVIDNSPWGDEEYDGTCFQPSPVLIDVDGGNIHLTPPEVPFDINNDGGQELLSWTGFATGDAFLARDRNNNGVIDDGSELFGNFTPLHDGSLAEHGFEALAEFDLLENGGHGDGKITEQDDAFSELLLWRDTNRDGLSAGELQPATQGGLVSIDLDFIENRRRDRYGNEFRYNSKAEVLSNGRLKLRKVADVFLVTGE